MNISEEMYQRLKFDQVVAREVLKFLVTVYKQTPETIAPKLGVDKDQVLDWFLERTEIAREDCWKIFELTESEIVPLEWMIRGDILNEYDPELIVILAREFVKLALARFKDEASPDNYDGRTLSIVVPSAGLTVYEIGSWPGRCKLGLGIRLLRDELQTNIHRIDENEAEIGGTISISLPLIPEALNPGILTHYDRHADHSFNFRDYLELIRMVRNGTVVDNNYFMECYQRALEKQLPGLGKGRKRTPRTV